MLESGLAEVSAALNSHHRWVVDPLGDEDDGKRQLGDEGRNGNNAPAAWAKWRYYVICWDGPRAGECSAETFALGRLAHMHEGGQLPDKVQVWPADGDNKHAGWRRIRAEIEAMQKGTEAL